MTPLPRIVQWLLTRAVPVEWRDSILGDLEEDRLRRRGNGRRTGRLWAIAAAIGLVWRLAAARRGEARRARPDKGAAMDGLIADIRQAVRGLRKNAGFAVTAMLTLALGIGANTAVFSLANWLLLRPLPAVRAQDRLVTIGFASGLARAPVSVPDLDALRAGMPALRGLAGYQNFALHIARGGRDPQRVDAEVVAGGYFEILDGAVSMGRRFSTEEERDPGAPATVIVSHRFWTTTLGGDPAAIGERLLLNGHPFTVIGITARGFHGTTLGGATDAWVPIAQHRFALPQYPGNALTNRRSTILFGMIGRLAPGASIESVGSQADVVRGQIAAAHPEDKRMAKWRFDVRGGTESRPWIRDRLGSAMTLLMGVVALLLVLTAANVANLILARATARRGEIAARLALGATRLRVARLLFAESLIVALAAGGLAIVLAAAAGRALEGTIVLQSLPPLDRAEIDWRVLGYAFGVAALAALAAGVVPAIAASRLPLTAGLHDAARWQTAGRGRLRRALTVAQIAVSVTLLIGAALLLRSMAARLSIDPGFDPSKVLSFSVEPGLQGYGPRQAIFYREVLDSVRRAPGVRAAGLAWLQPYSQGAADTSFKAEGETTREMISANENMVSPGFFDALGLQIVDGRDFTGAEFQRTPSAGEAVVILTETLARKTFGGSAPVGRRIVMAYPEGQVRTVVGVVRDTRQQRLTVESSDMLFEPFGQTFPSGWASVLVGLSAPQEIVVPALREAVRQLDPTLPIYDVIRLDRAIEKQFADELLMLRLTTVFAAFATVLAGVGLYAVLACGVAERRREFGIRTALGARPAAIGALITREALRVAAVGVTIGSIAAVWLTGYLTSRLFGVSRLDPLAFTASIAVVCIVAMTSALVPARRAARVDAIQELKV